MLNSAPLTVLDNSISTRLPDFTMMTPIFPIDLFHFYLKSFSTALAANISLKFRCLIELLLLLLLLLLQLLLFILFFVVLI